MNKSLYYRHLIYNLIKQMNLSDKAILTGVKYRKAHGLHPLDPKLEKIIARTYRNDKRVQRTLLELSKDVKQGRKLGLIGNIWYETFVGILYDKQPYDFNQVFMNAVHDFAKKANLLNDKKVQKRLQKPLYL